MLHCACPIRPIQLSVRARPAHLLYLPLSLALADLGMSTITPSTINKTAKTGKQQIATVTTTPASGYHFAAMALFSLARHFLCLGSTSPCLSVGTDACIPCPGSADLPLPRRDPDGWSSILLQKEQRNTRDPEGSQIGAKQK